MINLSEEEFLSGKFRTQFQGFAPIKDFLEAELCGANIIEQNEDGSCFYLKDNRCSIHDSKPVACKNFFCKSTNPAFKGMIEDIKKKKSIQTPVKESHCSSLG
jgi:Fe-S-cluster containining protein